MHRSLVIVGLGVALCAGGVIYTKAMGRLAPGTPPAMAAPEDQADAIRVTKADRRLELLREGAVIASYEISLGGAPEAGPKAREGDQRTPEGLYEIDWRNPKSRAHLSLHISYPNAADRAAASARGQSPGGDIMIHGLANGFGLFGGLHRLWDWTDGCIAVTNAEMEEIWSRVPNGTPIEIRG